MNYVLYYKQPQITPGIRSLKLILVIFTFLISILSANTQNLDTLTISGFEIHGLEKTRRWYVLREIRYTEGDRILLTDVEQAMVYIKSDLRKTNLFLKVDVNALFSYEESPEVKFIINIQENWFIYPSLIFELADRNFNVWWDEFDHSFKRVNIGLGIDHTNFTGAKDRIRTKYQFGYSTKTDITYNRPALSANSKIGLHGGIYYSEYKEFPLFTNYDKPVFIKYEYSPLYITREFVAGVQYKKNKLWNYLLNFNLHLNSIRGEYARNYPDFFLNGDRVQHYNTLYANVSYVDIDHPLKPTRGLYISWGLIKTGIGWWENYNYLSISQDIKASKKLFNRCYLINGLYAKYALDRKKRPYNIYKSFSYGGTNISGYEYYVINGLDYVFLSNELRYTIAKYNWKLFKIFRNEPIFRLTTEIDLSCQANAGYVNDPFYKQNNDLVNTLLYSTGLGLNFTLNDMFEFNIIYSINHLKETGFYFHTRKAF